MICNFAKILEKIIKNRLIKFLEDNKLLSKNQFGFRPGLSSEDALYSATKFISNSLDNGEKTLAIFLDLAKAFDSRLLKILPSFGIKNNSLKWFANYIQNRKQLVNVNGTLGEEKSIIYGVPQGSVLGPILFLMYVNNICNTQIDGQIVTYVDDTCLLFSDKTWESVHIKATLELKKVVHQLTSKLLSLNIKKTYYMTFSINISTIPLNEINVHFCDNNLKCSNTDLCQKILRVNSTRYLGVTFDKHLRWTLHINYLIKRLRIAVHHFYKLQSILPKDTIRTVYMSFYQAVFQYGIRIWGGTTENVLKPLKLQQNKMIRVCLGKHSLEGSTLKNYQELKVLPVKLIYKKFAILWVVKNINNWFNKTTIDLKRMDRAYNATVSYTNTSFGQRFLDYQGPICFNSLESDEKKCICNTPKHAKIIINNWLYKNMEFIY